MADVIQELSQSTVQNDDSIVAAHRIKRLIVVLEARKLRFGPYYDTAKEAIAY